MVHPGAYILVLLYFQNQGHSTIIPLPVEKENGCYGNTADDFLEPQCNGSKIAVSKVYAMTKREDTGCPNAATIFDHDEAKCCTVAPEDCKTEYRTESEDFLQDQCTGLEDCKVKTAWMETTCNTTVYTQRSNYMLMEYHCVPDDLILQATSSEDGSTSGRAVYLQNTGYPAGSDIGGECSVTSSCKTTLAISVIHMQVTGDCDHVIQVTDDGEENYIDCSNNNDDDYALADVYLSSSHFLILNLDGADVTNSGPLWIQVRGLNHNATMDLRCGASAVSTPPDVDVCPIEFMETTTSSLTSATETDPHHTSTSSSTPSTSSTSSTPSSAGSTATEGSSTGIIVGVVAALLILVVAGYIIYRKKKKARVSDSQQNLVEDGRKEEPADGRSAFYDNLVFNADGLPEYLYPVGAKPGVIKQTHPLQTRLLIRSELKPPPPSQLKPVRVSTGLRRFDQGKKIVYSGSESLPMVRAPRPGPATQDQNPGPLDPFGLTSAGKLEPNGLTSAGKLEPMGLTRAGKWDPIGLTSAGKLDPSGLTRAGKLDPNDFVTSDPRGNMPDNEMSQIHADELSESHKEKRKKKKKKKKLDPDDGDPTQTKKKKKKKKKDRKTNED